MELNFSDFPRTNSLKKYYLFSYESQIHAPLLHEHKLYSVYDVSRFSLSTWPTRSCDEPFLFIVPLLTNDTRT